MTKQGFMQILSLYASINRGMSKKASQTYPDVIPAPRPLISLPDNLNPQWVSGFVAGDGGFMLDPPKIMLQVKKFIVDFI